jgi:hypothetical protein
MKLRILMLYPEMLLQNKQYLVLATPASPENPLAMIQRPGVLEFYNEEKGQWEPVEMRDVLESITSGDVRELPPEVQVPVYTPPTRGGEERGSEPGSDTTLGSGSVHEEGDGETTH